MFLIQAKWCTKISWENAWCYDGCELILVNVHAPTEGKEKKDYMLCHIC